MSGGQYINHFGGVRIRVTGSGNLIPTLISLDTTTELELSPVAMQATTARYANQLSNFVQQKAQLELKTTQINEIFNLQQILIYIRPMFTSFPQ